MPHSRFYIHLGQSGVELFFMITGFLFFSKLLEAKAKGGNPDWLRLYVSRVLRLTPLYLVAMAVLFAILAVLSGGKFAESPYLLIRHALQWLAFTVIGNPDVNAIQDTYLVTGVTWSLVYEWYFYLSLPLLALALRLGPPYRYVGLGLVAAAAFVLRHADWHFLVAFGGGMVAALAAVTPVPAMGRKARGLDRRPRLRGDGRRLLPQGLLGPPDLAAFGGVRPHRRGQHALRRAAHPGLAHAGRHGLRPLPAARPGALHAVHFRDRARHGARVCR